MKIKTLKFALVLLASVALFISCSSDDDSGSSFVEADRTEQQELDNAEILAYLNSHYYNSSFFESGSNHKYTDIIISELPTDDDGNYLDLPDPTNNTLLISAVETRTVTFMETDYEYYVLSLNQGEGDAPKFTDKVRVRYEGRSINENVGGEEAVFDSSATPVSLNLQTDYVSQLGAIKAWQLVMPTFKAAIEGDFSIVDGVVSYNNPGLGLMFVPSGLAYFSGVSTGSIYDNLIFKFELLQFETEDHDNDGIPSYIEDLNGNLELEDDDTDGDGFYNFIDFDDDGDDVLTIDELIPNVYDINPGEDEPILAANEFLLSKTEYDDGSKKIKTVTIADSNNDGTPDYLDANITINYNVATN